MNKPKLSPTKIIVSLLIIFTIGCPTGTFAADLAVGTLSCKEWIEDRNTDTNYINKSVDQSWVIGFLTAYAEGTKINFLAGVKEKDIFHWIDKYCSTYPLKRIDDATLILAHELKRKMAVKPKSE